MKLVRTEDAVGQMLCHDITKIVKDGYKGVCFKKGHIITEEDVPVLKDLGKFNIYIWENDESMMHENDAAEVLREMSQGKDRNGGNMHVTDVKEGKVELISDIDGLFVVDMERLRKLNMLGEMMIATIPSDLLVRKGQKLGGMRIIPLIIKKEKLEEAKRTVGNEPLMKVLPFYPKKFGVVTTGNEVYTKRIKDTFTPTIVEKLEELGCKMVAHEISDDDNEHIEACIRKMIANPEVEMIFCTGGMSVDPDDRTPLAIKNVGAEIVTYGTPILPGAMFLMGYLPDGRPICGLPGCVMHARRTAFDLVLPKILANIRVTREYLAGLGYGGLCWGCKECHYPNCTFGKGL